MYEYKLMNRKQLTDYIFKFWLDFGIPEYQKSDEELRNEIFNNLGSFGGIEKELDAIRCAFEIGFVEDSKEYNELEKLWNYVNWYKTNFKER